MSLLVADIGGTNTRVALASGAGIGPVTAFRNAGFPDLASLLGRYLDSQPVAARPRAGALSVAAPIRGDEVRMSNIDWHFSRAGLRQALVLDELLVANDFSALARSLPELGAADLVAAGGGAAVATAPRIAIGPGTGLGVAGLLPVGGGWLTLPGEGGHATLGAADDREEIILRAARQRYGHCSAERLLSGHGLAFLHETLHGGAPLTPEAIGARFAAGERDAAETLSMFFGLLGGMAANVALTLGAFGGVYIGGGIVPRYLDAFLRSPFRERFEAKGRYRDYLRAIPAWVIVDPNPALKGLAALARDARPKPAG
ncbi:glucokinase [Gammaproteobacteria bacterium]|nr:glucokinase [Gammaproteobacteria bacterium]